MDGEFTKEFEMGLNEHTDSITKQVFEGMPGGFFIYRADDKEELVFFNMAMVHIFG